MADVDETRIKVTKTKITGHTITRVYDDGSSHEYKLEIDGENLYLKDGDNWFTFPVVSIDVLMAAISDLRSHANG